MLAIPANLRRGVRRWRSRVRRALNRPRWGNLRRLEPFSASFGFDRGTPIDRYYMAQFFLTHSEAFRGIAGEVVSSSYLEAFGGGRIEKVSIIDNDPTNKQATMIADLSVEGSLPAAHFDVLVVTQLLQYVERPEQVIGICMGALRPGGTLLLAVPALTAHDRHERQDRDYWRFWPAGLVHTIQRAAPEARRVVTDYGNLVAAVAFLQGLSAEELERAELDHHDPHYPVVICARLDKPEGSADR
jgi:SAM-dependent methyltransferase